MKILRFLFRSVFALVLFLAALWAFGALWYDFPIHSLSKVAAVVFAVAVPGVRLFLRPWWRGQFGVAVMIGVVMAWWFSLKPSNEGDWQPDVAQLARAEVHGDEITFYNVRNCDYRTETDYTPRWETRTVRLSQVTGVDIAINYWGSPYMAHPIISFQFADAPPLCFSIETRKKKGQSYSAIGGLYRQYSLIYVVADERDVIRVRTNYRHGEEIFLYPTRVSADRARERLMEYVETINHMDEKARWYNAVTTNCTTSIRSQHPRNERVPWDWRMLVNGFMDQMLYENHVFIDDGLPFAELKKRALINSVAKAADADPDFSKRIREGLPKR